MKRPKALPGDEYFCGTILGEDGRSGRHVMVTFKCAHCPLTGRARFSEVRNGATKSCRCRKIKCFVNHCLRAVSKLQYLEYKTIFETAELQGVAVAAAETGINAYVVSFAWQKKCKEIAAWHPGLLAAIYETCQISSTERAMSIYSLSRAETRRANFIAHRAHLAANALMEAEQLETNELVTQWRRANDKEALLANSILEETRSNLDLALSDLKIEAYWRKGEFTKKELQKNLDRRSDYGWIYHHLSAMTPNQITTCYGHNGSRFLNACDYSFLIRNQRVRDFLEQEIGHEKSESLPTADQTRRAPVRRNYVPRPGMSPADAARMVVGYLSSLGRSGLRHEACRSYKAGLKDGVELLTSRSHLNIPPSVISIVQMGTLEQCLRA